MEYLPPALPIETPRLIICSNLGEIALTHVNTRLRLFDDPQFNHVEYLDREGNTQAFIVTQAILDTMHEHNYPQLTMPYVDTATMEWFVKINSRDLEGQGYA